MEKLYSQMNDTNVIFEYERFSLWEFPEKFSYIEDPSRPLPEDSPDNNKVKHVVEICEEIEALLRPIAEPAGLFKNLCNLLFDKTLGYADYVCWLKHEFL